MGPFRYRHSGLLVESALELPEWHAFVAADGGEADVTIRFAPTLGKAAPPNHTPVMEGEALRFSVPDVGTWRISGGRLIEIEPFGDPASIEVRLFTLGSAWGTLGYQRGWAMLHGSAVLGPKGAVLFCGPQGAGKSTMAAALAQQGLPLVSDDLSRVEPGRADKPTRLWPSSTRHKLWDEAIDRLGLSDRERVQDYFRADKFHLESSTSVPVELPVPLVGIYALDFGDSFRIERLTGAEAATSVLRETIYRPLFLEAMGRLAEQAVHAARIAASVPVWRLTRPADLAQLSDVGAQLIGHLEQD
ncbi:hypothetical protein LY632_11750 [Erythrobacter sp. SDW2]|uniref:hypothetical protein n=1 Tax=Erythrobacter sp. SDW2 TaxID=2907154 RepID=UPI001F28C2B8|nr:hypothetical protein [Erythrobacter sp. SDW2]UIP06358.1 hypothetical protein LY632_11750 [Erythrobacter sp. SDW2]